MSFNIKNFTMRKFNNDVNNTGDLDAKYTAWSAHRSSVTGFIRNALSQSPSAKSIIVFGAGECNDIDLQYLSTAFERIVLTDVDEQSIFDGLARQGEEDTFAASTPPSRKYPSLFKTRSIMCALSICRN